MCGQQMCVEFQPTQEAGPVLEHKRLGEQLLVVPQKKRALRLAEQHLGAQWLRWRWTSATSGSRLRLQAIEPLVAAAVDVSGRRRGSRQRVTERTQRLRRDALLEQRVNLLRACRIGKSERCFQTRGDYTASTE